MTVEKQGNAITTSIVSFFKGMKAEIVRITWPSKENVKKSFLATLVYIFIWIVIVALLDQVFTFLFDKIF